MKLTLTGDGAIRLFRAVELDGRTNYLFDRATASNQVVQSESLHVGMLSSGTPITLTNRSEHFIWCGVTNGSAEVHLQVFDGNTNLLADTATYLQIKDIKQMYERWTVGDSPNLGPTNIAHCAAEDLPTGAMPFQYNQSARPNTPYILLVHGWNMERWEKDRFAETAFKRLYWQGYQGRFGLFRWPTYFDFPAAAFSMQALDPRNYDNSEYNAWRSAQGLMNKLAELNAEYPGHVYMLAHSMGNVVAGEALRLAGNNQIVNTYVASQAAVPAHTYDSTVTNAIDFTHRRPDYPVILSSYGPDTPNIYRDWLAGNSAAVGRRINFYNPNDYALSPDLWSFDQELKPDQGFFGWSYGFDGYPQDGTQKYNPGSPDDGPPWNHFFKTSPLHDAVSFDIVNVLTNRYEVMACAAEARSTALGSTPVTTLSEGVDLSRSLNPIWPPDPSGHDYADHKWHSAEFRSTNMEQHNYWNELLGPDGFNLQ